MTPELIIFFTAMIPFADLKLAIPLGIDMGLPLTLTLIFAVAGTLIPAALTLTFIDPVINFARNNSKIIDAFITKLLNKTQHEHSKNFNRYGAIFLIMLVGIPIPGSGPVTGSVVSYVFGVDRWKAFTLVTIGAVISGLLVAGGTESIIGLIHLFA